MFFNAKTLQLYFILKFRLSLYSVNDPTQSFQISHLSHENVLVVFFFPRSLLFPPSVFCYCIISAIVLTRIGFLRFVSIQT